MIEHSHFNYVLLGFAAGVAFCAIYAGYIWFVHLYKGFSKKPNTAEAVRHVEKQVFSDEVEEFFRESRR